MKHTTDMVLQACNQSPRQHWEIDELDCWETLFQTLIKSDIVQFYIRTYVNQYQRLRNE